MSRSLAFLRSSIWTGSWNHPICSVSLHARTHFASVWRNARKNISSTASLTFPEEEKPITITTDSRYGGKQIIRVNEPVYDYILAHTREPQVLSKLREETSSMRGSQMQVSPEQGQFLAMLVKLMGAERCIEVGIFTGYSSLAVALVLPEHGHLVACERNKDFLDIAQKYYEKAGVSHKGEIYHGLALDTLKNLLDKGEANSYDFTFLDGDKRNYADYYESLLQLVNDEKTQILRNLNSFLHQDNRVDVSMVPIGDGVTICRKR